MFDKNTSHPKLGFAGLGWIGLKRLQPLADEGWEGELVIFDPDQLAIENTKLAFPEAKIVDSYEELLRQELDGIVIASPSALHASQAKAALQAGFPVFCQKPLGRNYEETKDLVSLAQEKNLLICVDFSYRFTEGVQQVKNALKNQKIGNLYAVEAVFHNAYGPDKDWYYAKEKSGGGCLMDLGSHLVDLIQHLIEVDDFQVKYSNLLSKGKSLDESNGIEDFAEAQLKTDEGISIRIACSWKHSVGKDAEIYIRINGTEGGLEFYNVRGSFYEFQSKKYHQNSSEVLSSAIDSWEGKTLCKWVDSLRKGSGFDPESLGLMHTSRILDEIYRQSGV